MRLVVNLAKKDLFKQTLTNLLKMDQIQAHNSPDPPDMQSGLDGIIEIIQL